MAEQLLIGPGRINQVYQVTITKTEARIETYDVSAASAQEALQKAWLRYSNVEYDAIRRDDRGPYADVRLPEVEGL